MQETSRTRETMERCDKVASGPRRTHVNDAAAKAGVIGEPVGTRQHSELGQAHRLRVSDQSVQRATACEAESCFRQAQ